MGGHGTVWVAWLDPTEHPDSVVVRPWWDPSRYYWAGTGQHSRGLPRLGPPPTG